MLFNTLLTAVLSFAVVVQQLSRRWTMPKRTVVLPEGPAGHPLHAHKDPWHQLEGIVFVLIAVHLSAFLYWCYLLYVSRQAKKRRMDTNPEAAKAHDWRTPRDILGSYEKNRLGKT